jgi:hypothetical protein
MSEDVGTDIDPDTGMPVNPLFPKMKMPEQVQKIEMQRFQMRFAKAEDGGKVLILMFEIPPDKQVFFAIHGEELIKFFQYVKAGLIGNDTPSYLR